MRLVDYYMKIKLLNNFRVRKVRPPLLGRRACDEPNGRFFSYRKNNLSNPNTGLTFCPVQGIICEAESQGWWPGGTNAFLLASQDTDQR